MCKLTHATDTLVTAIDVVATSRHRHQRLCRAVLASEAALAVFTVTHDELVAQLHANLLAEEACVPAVVSKIIAGLAAKKVNKRASYVSAPRLVETLGVLREYGITAKTMDDALAAAADLDEASSRRLIALRDAMRDSDRCLGQQHLVAKESLLSKLTEKLEDISPGHSLCVLLDVEEPAVRVELSPSMFSWSCASFYLALARHLRSRRGTLAIHLLAEPARERWSASLDRTLRLIEETEDIHIELTYGLRSLSTGESTLNLQRFVHSMAAGGRTPEAPVSVADAAGIEESAHWAVHQVERWLREGMSPDQIALIVRTEDAQQVEPLVRALHQSNIAFSAPASTRIGGSISAAISLAKALAEGGDVERTAFALSALAGPNSVTTQPVTAIVHAARAMRARDVFAPELQKLSRHVSQSTAETAQRLASLLAPLGSEATIQQHCERWIALLDVLNVRARLTENLYSSKTDSRPLRESMGREARGVAQLFRTLHTLPGYAAMAGLRSMSESDSISPIEFAAILEGALTTVARNDERVGSGGVSVIAASSALGQSYRAVVVVGVEDGRFPAHATDDVILGPGERKALKSQTGISVAHGSTKEDETQLFLGACATAVEQLALVGAKHDLGGRVLAPSPFMVDARRVLDRVPIWVGRDPLARSAMLPPRGQERLCRVYSANGKTAAPASVLDRVRSARVRSLIERERSEFFEGIRSEPGRFSGRIEHDPLALEALNLARYATTSWPLDVTSLERTARCAFKAFAQQVLKLEPEDVPSLLLDPKGLKWIASLRGLS